MERKIWQKHNLLQSYEWEIKVIFKAWGDYNFFSIHVDYPQYLPSVPFSTSPERKANLT